MPFRRSLLEIHLAVLLFGLAGLFGKWLVLSPLLIVLGRVLFASLGLAAILCFLRQSLRLDSRGDYLLLFFMGFVLALHWVCFFRSIQVSTVAIGLLAYSSFPVFTVLLEPLFLKERIDKLNIVFALICLLGVFLIVPHLDLSHIVFKGVVWGLLSGLTFAILSILNRKLAQKYSSLTIAFFQDFFATLLLLPFVFLIRADWSLGQVGLLVLLGVVCTAGSHTLFIQSMKKIRAQTASIISSLEPVYGIILAYVFLREIPAFRTVAGGLVILAAVLLITFRARLFS